MDILRPTDSNAEDIFRTVFSRRNLVLVCGAGFTKGCPSRKGQVPDAGELQSLMLRVLREKVGEEASTLSNLKFAEIAEHFLNPEFVPPSTVKEILRDHFTGVTLGAIKKDFLKCPWPYVYTLNIDDAIEHNSSYRSKIISNRRISPDARHTVPCVFKVHGCAEEELLYDEPSKIIFSTGQYVRSLTTNESMLNALRTDLVEGNILFVGCSLDSEIDLLYALAEYQGKFPAGRRSIYVTRSEPNKFQAAKLRQHGVNTVFLVDDYDAFYSWAFRVARSLDAGSQVRATVGLPAKSLRKLGKERALNQAHLLQDPKDGHLDEIPYYYAERDVQSAVIDSTTKHPITLVRGRRFSGKTLLLKSIAQASRAKDVLYFPSLSTISQEEIAQLADAKNSLLLFDSNVLTADTAYAIGKNSKQMSDNGTTMVVAANRTEPDVTGTLSRFAPEEADFDVESRLSQAELGRINQHLDSLGLIRFESGRSILDNTFRLIREYQSTSSNLTVARAISDEEMEVLLVIAIVDKAYSSLATALGVRSDQLFDFCERMAPIIDRVETSVAEQRSAKSKYKLVANSRLGLAYQIGLAVSGKGYSWLSSRLEAAVRKLHALPDFKATAGSMFMFDAVNFVLEQASPSSARTGYRPVLRQLYDQLQSTLNDSPDYWLQRSKATLNIDDDEASLLKGVEFALKAYSDATRTKTMDNAEFSIALLFGKLCAVTKYAKPQYVASAVEWFARAVRNYHRNPDYVQRIFEDARGRRSWFSQLCEHLEGPITAPELLSVRGDIQFLLQSRRVAR